MEHVRGVQLRPQDPVKSMKKVLAHIDTKAEELDVCAVGFRAWEPVFISMSLVSCVISSWRVLDVGS